MMNYYLLLKPGIILGNLMTFAAGFFLASRGALDLPLFLFTSLGLAAVIASASIFNNYIDKKIDKDMKRTEKRPLAQGVVSEAKALLFGALLGGIGNGALLLYANVTTLVITDVAFFVYVILYSLFFKRRTVYGTAVGSVAGAAPPVIGYCAVTDRIDEAALILFAMMVLWQMPHFFAITLRHLEDYKAARIPVLPLEKGIKRTKVHMALYILAFSFVAPLLSVYHYTGYLYSVIALTLGLLWLLLCIKGFKVRNEKVWGQQMFCASLVLITFVCLAIPLDTSPF